MFSCRDTTGLLYAVSFAIWSICNEQPVPQGCPQRMEAHAAQKPKTTQNFSYCISGYEFTFLISLPFSRQPHGPIQMSLAMTQVFINMYADNQPKRIIKSTTVSFPSLPPVTVSLCSQSKEESKSCPTVQNKCSSSLMSRLLLLVHLDLMGGWSGLIKRHLKRILYLLLF